MKVNDRVATERQHVLAFALAGGVLLLMAVVVALSFGRDAHGWTWASGALLEDLMPWRWPPNYGGAVCGSHAGGGGLYYSAADRKPDGKPEVLGISSGAAFGVVLMLFLVPGNAFGGVTCRQSRRGGDAVDHYDRRRTRWIFPTPHVTGGDGVKYRVHHAFDDVAGKW